MNLNIVYSIFLIYIINAVAEPCDIRTIIVDIFIKKFIVLYALDT